MNTVPHAKGEGCPPEGSNYTPPTTYNIHQYQVLLQEKIEKEQSMFIVFPILHCSTGDGKGRKGKDDVN